MHSDRRFILNMLTCGASGYLLKDCDFEEITKAIHTVSAGRAYLSSTIIDTVVQDYFHHLDKFQSAFTDLTNRERVILQNLAEGKSVKEIAGNMYLSVKTIETHRQQIMKKLGFNSIAELTKYAVREGLTSL